MSNTAVLDENGIATVAGDITVYHYDEDNPGIHLILCGVSRPSGWVLRHIRAPISTAGGNFACYVVCRTATLNGWEHVPDHRGETVYSTENGNPVLITQPGDYPADTTTKQPATPWDNQNGEVRG
ncbi:hypothetical protein AB2F13_08745 [Escherichia coli]